MLDNVNVLCHLLWGRKEQVGDEGEDVFKCNISYSKRSKSKGSDLLLWTKIQWKDSLEIMV